MDITTVQELETAWSQPEIRADPGTPEAMVTLGVLLGPLGFVVDRPQRLERYRSRDLVTGSL